MKKIEVLILVILTIAYCIAVLFVCSVFEFEENAFNINIPTKENIALFGAFVAFYNIFWNLYKHLREKIIKSPISISLIPNFNDKNIEVETSLFNNSEYPVSVDFCYLKGFVTDFQSVYLSGKESKVTVIKGQRSSNLRMSKNILGNSKINFQYRLFTNLSKYKNKSVKINLKCIE